MIPTPDNSRFNIQEPKSYESDYKVPVTSRDSSNRAPEIAGSEATTKLKGTNSSNVTPNA